MADIIRTELWYNESKQAFVDKKQGIRRYAPGDKDKDGNTFIWLLPENVYAVMSKWLRSIKNFSPYKHVTPYMVLQWTKPVSETAHKCLPKHDFKVRLSPYGDNALLAAFNRYAQSTYSVGSNEMLGVINPGPKSTKFDSDHWKILYSEQWGKFHFEPYVPEDTDPATLEKGYTDEYGWTLLGTTDKKTQDPLGYMLDHISLTTDPQPTLAEAQLWFDVLIPLIVKCYADFDFISS